MPLLCREIYQNINISMFTNGSRAFLKVILIRESLLKPVMLVSVRFFFLLKISYKVSNKHELLSLFCREIYQNISTSMITDGSWAFRTPHKRILYTFKFRFQPKPIIPYGIKLKRVKLNSKKRMQVQQKT